MINPQESKPPPCIENQATHDAFESLFAKSNIQWFLPRANYMYEGVDGT